MAAPLPDPSSMSELRIPTRLLPLTLELAGGGVPRPGAVHLAGGEGPLAFFESADRFFAFNEGGSVRLVARSAVRVARLAERLPGPQALTRAVEVVLTLSGGHREAGALWLDAPPERSRAVDVLNAASGRFVVLHQPGADLLVLLSAIESVELRPGELLDLPESP